MRLTTWGWAVLGALIGALGFSATPAAGSSTSIWGSGGGGPAAADAGSVELGLKFRSDVSGYILGVRFYKPAGSTGTHQGSLWTRAGGLLARATFVSETASGWQEVRFASAVPVTANTTYIASYFAPAGGYAYTGGAFAGAGVDNPPLHALRDGLDGGNGVYRYTSSPAFPAFSYGATNYWVDVVFTTESPVDSTPPTVLSVSPPPGSGGVPASTSVSAVFSEPMDPASIDAGSFELRGPSGQLVAAAVSYNAASRTALLQPSAPLALATPYTATVRGGPSDPRVKDLAGNALGANHTWQFTTSGGGGGGTPLSVYGGAGGGSASTDPFSVELGVRFRSDVAGYIRGIRFYKQTGNEGIHQGSLWTNSGTLLARATFTGESASGWQEVTFGQPVAITANTTYVASYFAPRGHYSYTSGAFAAAGVDNPPLHLLRDGLDGRNGVYRYSGAPAFPTETYQSTNYWVDVLFVTTEEPSPPTEGAPLLSLWGQSGGGSPSTDPWPLEVGVKFRTETAGFIHGVRFFKHGGNGGTHVGSLWSREGALLARATFSGESATGWQEVVFSQPVAVAANATYVASYFAPQGRYAYTGGGLASGHYNPPLRALPDGLDGGNGVYRYNTTPVFPNQSYGATNYWVDVLFATSDSRDPNPAVIALSFAPSAVPGGGSVTGTVRLASPTVTSVSVDVAVVLGASAVAVSPATVIVPAGVSNASFNVTTAGVGAPTVARLQASANGGSASGEFTVNPPSPALASLSFPPGRQVGTATVNGTVTLASVPAANVGVDLLLVSGGAAVASLPLSVTVPAGSASATFPLVTRAVASLTDVQVRASLNGATRDAVLTVRPPGVRSLGFSPGTVAPGGACTGHLLMEAPVAVATSIALSSDPNFINAPASVTVPAGARTVTFAASIRAGVGWGPLLIWANSPWRTSWGTLDILGDPALAPIAENAALPRVLLIGDSISIGYTQPTRARLAGQVNIQRINCNGAMSSRVLLNLNEWLGTRRWDVVHINSGLWDIVDINANSRLVTPAEYEENLRAIITRIKQVSNKVIWASTTPVPDDLVGTPRRNVDVLAYNAVALRVMQENGVQVNDLYGYVQPYLATLQIPRDVHFTPQGYDYLSGAVADQIRQALGL